MIKGEFILGSDDISVPVNIRKEVFQKELGISGYPNDTHDKTAMHAVLYDDDVPVASSRIYFNGEEFLLDYICVKKDYRNKLIGDLLTRITILKASDFAETMYIHCFTDTSDFFKKYGFKDTGKRDSISKYPAAWLYAKRDDITFMGKCGCCIDCHGCKQGE